MSDELKVPPNVPERLAQLFAPGNLIIPNDAKDKCRAAVYAQLWWKEYCALRKKVMDRYGADGGPEADELERLDENFVNWTLRFRELCK